MGLNGDVLTLEGINYQELYGSGTVRIGGMALEGRRVFFTEWADRIEFAKLLRGAFFSSQYPTSGEVAAYVKTPPKSFPDFEVLVCETVEIEGFGSMSFDSDTSDPTYDKAKITAIYRPRQGEENEGSGEEEAEEVLLTLDLDFQTQYLQYGRMEVKWVTTGELIVDPIPHGKLVVTIPRTYRQEKLPEIPIARLRACLGKVNSAAFDGVAAGYLLFTGASTQRTYMADGTRAHNITYNFQERIEATWNHFWNPRTEQWDRIQLVNGAAALTVYDTADFAAMLRAPLADV